MICGIRMRYVWLTGLFVTLLACVSCDKIHEKDLGFPDNVQMTSAKKNMTIAGNANCTALIVKDSAGRLAAGHYLMRDTTEVERPYIKTAYEWLDVRCTVNESKLQLRFIDSVEVINDFLILEVYDIDCNYQRITVFAPK